MVPQGIHFVDLNEKVKQTLERSDRSIASSNEMLENSKLLFAKLTQMNLDLTELRRQTALNDLKRECKVDFEMLRSRIARLENTNSNQNKK